MPKGKSKAAKDDFSNNLHYDLIKHLPKNQQRVLIKIEQLHWDSQYKAMTSRDLEKFMNDFNKLKVDIDIVDGFSEHKLEYYKSMWGKLWKHMYED